MAILLRKWQANCLNVALNSYYKNDKHFLCLASPGAGKTKMATTLANRLLSDGQIDIVMCFSPSIVVAQGFEKELSDVTGLRFDGQLGSMGCSYTYQKMASLDDNFWSIFVTHRVLVIFDEIHHCAGSNLSNANIWGELILKQIQDRATYTLALSGTPWRSDKLPITLANYCNETGKLQCGYEYGLHQAISDGVCRSPNICLIDCQKIEIQSNLKTHTYSSIKELCDSQDFSYNQLLDSPEFIDFLLEKSNQRLQALREKNKASAALVVAKSVAHAQYIQKALYQKTGFLAPVVSYLDKKSAGTINNFKQSDTPWIISIGMISEGTDIPRLQICCYLSHIKTELYFRQVLGRIIRVSNCPNERCYMYIAAEEALMGYAQQLRQDIPEQLILEKGTSTEIVVEHDSQGSDQSFSNDSSTNSEVVLAGCHEPYSSTEALGEEPLAFLTFGRLKEKLLPYISP